MSFTFEEFKTAVETYPESFVTIEIVDVTLEGDVMSTGDTGGFAVKIVNTGALHMDDVTLIVSGLNGMRVREGLPNSYTTQFETSVIERVNAHDTNGTTLRGYLYEAPADAQPAKNLIKATLGDWNANLEHITIGHSDPLTTVKGLFNSEVNAE